MAKQVTMVEQAMFAPSEIVSPGTPAVDIQRRFMAEEIRGLIVTEGRRPVGIITWKDLADREIEGKTVGDFMRSDPPLVGVGATLAEARTALDNIDDDVIGVVDTQGLLVGELMREQLRDLSIEVDAATEVISTTGAGDIEPEVTLIRGMRVFDSEREDFGEIADVVQDEYGRISDVDVRYGTLKKHTKRLPVDDIAGYGDNEIYLAVTKKDVELLPDVE